MDNAARVAGRNCEQPEHLCDCAGCDSARRAQVAAFAAKWFARRGEDLYGDLVEERSGVREVREVREVRVTRPMRVAR